MPHNRRRSDSLSSLPLRWKLLLLAASLLAGELLIAFAVGISVTIGLEPVRQAFGVNADLDSLVPIILPVLVVAGLSVGIEFYSKVRRWIDDQIARCG